MGAKLYIADAFPTIALNLVKGGSFVLPRDIDTRYMIALFYRGHW